MAGKRKWQNQERGASAVEFAFVLPVLLLILFGIIEFGLLLYNKQVITNASREGSRAGIVVSRLACTGAPSIQEVISNYSDNRLVSFSTTPSSAAVECYYNSLPPPNEPNWIPFTNATPPALFGNDLKVRVSYRYDFLLLPNFVSSLAGGLNLSADTIMKFE